MKKRWIALCVFVLIAAMLFGCGKSGGTTGGSAPAAPGGSAPATTPGGSAPATTPGGTPAAGSDLAYVKQQGELKIGITIYEPMNYYDANGKLIGFDTEFAQAVCKNLGVTPKFIEINWDTKEVELSAKNIDCIWNGFTITDDRKQSIAFSDPYIRNRQVAVIRAKDADKYKTTADMVNANIVAEQGSAGETAVQDDPSLKNAPYTAIDKQTDTLMEIKAGTADVAVLDYTLANSMVGPNTSYSDLMVVPNLALTAEEYGVGFRLGSDIVPAVNDQIKALTADGTLDTIAKKYDLTALLISNQ